MVYGHYGSAQNLSLYDFMYSNKPAQAMTHELSP
ncbi:MAG: Uncharacterised protein [Flavobacteriaceae bacterium]|nr:MAG: Uncharacterised protein [Flavobacteriaceae bacterium]